MASVILLSIIPEKKSRYLLPVLIPLALNTGFYIEYICRNFAQLKDKRERIPVYFHFGLIALIGLAFPLGGYLYLGDRLEGNWIWYVLLSMALFTIALYIIHQLKRNNIQAVFYATISFIIAIMCFGLPMANSLTFNPEYKGLSKLNEWQAQTNLKVYEFGDFTPEMIWDYGKPITVISKNGERDFPEEEQFGVLVSENNLNRFQRQFKDYEVEKVTRYDMNPQATGHRTHRPRLWRDFYRVSKK